jgi:hypothetical protein
MEGRPFDTIHQDAVEGIFRLCCEHNAAVREHDLHYLGNVP